MEEEILRDLIKEMKARVNAFDLHKSSLGLKHVDYWNGKMSEATFIVEKLEWILETGTL